MILCSDPNAQYLSHKDEIDKAVAAVLSGGRYILGQEVSSFEKEFSGYIGSKHAVGVGSGTEALHIALSASGVGPGDEVITPSHTAVATVSAIVSCGGVPVFADVEPDHFTIDPAEIKKLITKKTKAVVAVHLYGNPADMARVMEISGDAGLKVIEDCAQAHGAEYKGRKVGSIGHFGCFSFYPTKNLGAIGDGGMIVTSDPSLAEKAGLLRQYGWKQRYVSDIHGWNSRLDEIQAAILRVKLRYLDEDTRKRRDIAKKYESLLSGLPIVLPEERAGSKHVFHLYVIRSAKRDALVAFLNEKGVQSLIHYPKPVHMQPAYQRTGAGLENTEKMSGEIMSLPIYPELPHENVERVCFAVADFYGKKL